MNESKFPPDILERMERAVQKVEERLRRAMGALTDTSVPAAVIGAKAVAYWVGLKDEGLVRNTPNVDLLMDPDSAETSRRVLKNVGFICVVGTTRPMVFLDGPDGKERQAVRLWLVGDAPRSGVEPFFDLAHAVSAIPYRAPSLQTLLRMKLSAYRRIDRVHVRDMMDAGLIDATWLGLVPPEYRDRLQAILDDPDG